MRIILASSLALLAITLTSPLLAYAQDPFTFGNANNPFSFSSGGSIQSNSNATLQIRSNTDWSGTYGDSTGSTSVDGHGNKDISLSCSGTYSADFQKKSEGPGFLTLNIVQPVSHTLPQDTITRNGVPIKPGQSASLSKRIMAIGEGNTIDFSINQVSNSSSDAVDTNQPFNSTLRGIITNPDGNVISSNDTLPQAANFFPLPSPSPDIVGKYIFTIKNIGRSPVDVKIQYGVTSIVPPTATTYNVTNTRTTTAQFGTVSVAGSC